METAINYNCMYLSRLPDSSFFILSLHRPDGDTFLLQDQMSDDPKPKKGDVVTFEFDYGTRTVTPANPQINRIRKDLSWEEVQRNYERESQLNGISPPPSSLLLSFFFFFLHNWRACIFQIC